MKLRIVDAHSAIPINPESRKSLLFRMKRKSRQALTSEKFGHVETFDFNISIFRLLDEVRRFIAQGIRRIV